jgi:hypothetical protein
MMLLRLLRMEQRCKLSSCRYTLLCTPYTSPFALKCDTAEHLMATAVYRRCTYACTLTLLHLHACILFLIHCAMLITHRLLKQCALFSGCSDSMIRNIALHMQIEAYAQDDIIAQQNEGDTPLKLYK